MELRIPNARYKKNCRLLIENCRANNKTDVFTITVRNVFDANVSTAFPRIALYLNYMKSRMTWLKFR